MDVSSMARVFRGFTQYASQAKNTTNNKATGQNSASQTQTSSEKVGDAFELEISDAAKKALHPKEAAEEALAEEAGAKETKGLSNEEVRALQDDLAAQEQTMLNVMIQALTDANDKLQGWLDDGVGVLNFDGVQIDAARFGLPEVATNAEDAAKAIAPGGAWSVDAVATRICDLAFAIAGDDPEKLSQMRTAIDKGFEQAGMTWNKMTGQSNMPSITQDTNTEIMNRFDKRANELSGNSGASLTE